MNNSELNVKYSSLVDTKTHAELVLKDGVIFNTRYQGDPTAGAVMVPVRDTEVAVGDYDKQNGADKTHGDTAYITLAIDKQTGSTYRQR